MRALVVYESMFGNTQTIAEAIADGLATSADVRAVEVSSAPTTIGDDVDLLVVGGPTHAFSLSRASTRRDAAQKGGQALVSSHIGLREWLAQVHTDAHTVAAAFDTKVRTPHLPGSAARAAAKRLRHLGLRLAAPATTFYVDGMTGPLLDGERGRAQTWGEHLAARVPRPVAGHR
jgi:flavorubredoxin